MLALGVSGAVPYFNVPTSVYVQGRRLITCAGTATHYLCRDVHSVDVQRDDGFMSARISLYLVDFCVCRWSTFHSNWIKGEVYFHRLNDSRLINLLLYTRTPCLLPCCIPRHHALPCRARLFLHVACRSCERPHQLTLAYVRPHFFLPLANAPLRPLRLFQFGDRTSRKVRGMACFRSTVNIPN